MHITKKNSLVQNININSNSIEVSADGLDGIFAELFSSVNLSSIDSTDQDPNIAKFTNSENNFNEINAAKSLISIFINEKDIGIKSQVDESTEKTSTNLKTNVEKSLITLMPQNSPLKELSKENIDLIFPNENKKKNPLINERINIILKKKITKNIKNLIKVNEKSLQSNITEKDSNLQKTISEKNLLNNTDPQKNNLVFNQKKPKNLSKGKSNKMKIVELETKFSGDVNKLDKTEFVFRTNFMNVPQKRTNFERSNNQNFGNSQQNENILKDLKEVNFKLTSKSTSLSDQKYLDLMESGWGEKFAKTLKSSIHRGVQKIDFDLQPKNLGKLKVEITYEDGKTNIKINTDNKNVANILNDNQAKLTEMLDKEQIKFDEYSTMTFNNNFNEKNNQDGSEKNSRNEDIGSIDKASEKSEPKSTNRKKNTHKVDINA